jgi:hypothetical protein
VTGGEIEAGRAAAPPEPEREAGMLVGGRPYFEIRHVGSRLYQAMLVRPLPKVLAAEASRAANAAQLMLEALRDVELIRPSNWDDGEDPDQMQAWRKVADAIAKASGR